MVCNLVFLVITDCSRIISHRSTLVSSICATCCISFHSWFSYSMFRGKGVVELGNVGNPSRSQQKVIFLFFLLLSGYFFALELITDVDYYVTYQPEAIGRNIKAFASMPLLLLQISNKLFGILFVFKLAILYIVVSQCKKNKWFFILLLWVTAEIIQAVYIKGARSGLVFLILATALFYHRMIKPLNTKYLVISGMVFFTLFIYMGLYRSYTDIADMQADIARSEAGVLSSGSEFQALLGTAYDVYKRKEAGAKLPWYLYINDIMTILPPQQLMPFKKVLAADWYLEEIGLGGKGVGFMWGVISQAIVGLDWFELAIRGAILGFILARFHRWYLRHKTRFLETLLYVYMCLRVYYTYRDTTLSILAFVVWEVIPFYLVLRISSVRKKRNTIPFRTAIQNNVQDMQNTHI